MNKKLMLKIAVDIGMTACLLLLMPYSLVGETAHEWIGMAIFFLFVVHHILNRKWLAAVTRGTYPAFRTIQTILVAAMLILMSGSMISGIVLSNHIFRFVKPFEIYEMAQRVHMFCAYWGFVVLAVHLGVHWNIVTAVAGKIWRRPSVFRRWIARAAALLAAGYGIYAFDKRQIGDYLFLRNHFLFLDGTESVWLFLLDYLAVMSLVICVSYYFSKVLKKIPHGGSVR